MENTRASFKHSWCFFSLKKMIIENKKIAVSYFVLSDILGVKGNQIVSDICLSSFHICEEHISEAN